MIHWRSWAFEPDGPEGEPIEGWPMPASTPTSTRLAADLKRRGWTWLGPTTAYAFMQAMGLVNDHRPGCWVRGEVELERAQLRRPTLPATPRPGTLRGAPTTRSRLSPG